MAGLLRKIVRRMYETVFGESPRSDFDESLESQGIKRVAAGDPSQTVSLANNIFVNLPQGIRCGNEEIILSDFDKFLVEGSSMVPRGVMSGDLLLCVGKGKEAQSKFVIVSADKGYYERKNKDLKFEYKLRHELTDVNVNESERQLESRLENLNSDIFLDKNKKNFRKKFQESKKYFGGSDQQLVVSETFRSGKLRYSFYPADLACFKALYALRHVGNNWKVINLQEECPV